MGDYNIEVKKTSLHITHGSAFLGIHPKKNWLDLNIVLNHELKDPLVRKNEQVSKFRWHNEVRLSRSTDIDPSLINAIQEAYARTK